MTSRQSRAQESRKANPVRESRPAPWEQGGVLAMDIPPRDGYVHRWVRTTVKGDDDQSNVFQKMNYGWRPRDYSTVETSTGIPHLTFEGSEVIGIRGMILMERPAEVHEQQAMHVKQQTHDQMLSVEHNLLREHDPKSGLTSPEMNVKSGVVKGRIVQVDD